MSAIIILFSFLLFQESPFTKLVYELTGTFSDGNVTNVTLWQYYDDEGQMVIGGYKHKLNQSLTNDPSSAMESGKIDLDSEEIQNQLREAGLTSDQIRAIRSGPTIDSRTQFMLEYDQAPEFFMTTADSVFDIRVGMKNKEVLGFPRSILQWELHEEMRDINGYQCQKATINYFGRTFTAWFSPEIPLNAGPYLFSGLPGAIVELNDDHEVYTYSLLEVGRSELPEGISFPERQDILSHEEAVRKQWAAVQRYLGDLMGTERRVQRMLSRQVPEVAVNNSQHNAQPLVFNPHEHFLEWIILDDLLQE